MKAKYYLCLSILVMMVSSCKKEKIEDPVPDQSPVFYATGTLGVESFSAQAGKDNFYMNSGIDIVNGVNFYKGNLSNSEFEMEMGIYDGFVDYLTPMILNTLPENLQYSNESYFQSVTLSKDSFPNSDFINQIAWYVDGVYSGINEITLNEPGKFNVCATVYFNDGSQRNVCNQLIVGYARHANGQLVHFVSGSGELNAWINLESSVALAEIKWYLDDVLVGTEEKYETNLDDEIHTLRADFVLTNGVARSKSIIVDGGQHGRFLDDFSAFEQQSGIPFQDYTVRIKVKKNGKTYRSELTNNVGSTMTVNNISYFGLSPVGDPIFKINATIQCMLKDESSGDVLPFDCVTSFGVEIH